MMKSGTIAKSVRYVFVGGSVVAIEVPAAVEGTAQQMNNEQLRRRIAAYARSLRHPVNELLAERADRGLSSREAYTLSPPASRADGSACGSRLLARRRRSSQPQSS